MLSFCFYKVGVWLRTLIHIRRIRCSIICYFSFALTHTPSKNNAKTICGRRCRADTECSKKHIRAFRFYRTHFLNSEICGWIYNESRCIVDNITLKQEPTRNNKIVLWGISLWDILTTPLGKSTRPLVCYPNIWGITLRRFCWIIIQLQRE